MDKAAIIEEACNALSNGSLELCKSIITSQYPFQNLKKKRTPIPKSTALRIFVRDGFIDRYSGVALIFPGTLRIISELLPDAFPYHPHGRLDLCHPAWWYLFPSIDHVIPVAFGGTDDDENLITTSNLLNMTKRNALLDDLDWTLYPSGNIAEWDGLLAWFMAYIQHDSSLLSCSYIADWYRCAKSFQANKAEDS